MYLRQSNQKRADGSVLSHLQIAENAWDPIKKRSRVRILHHCGRSDDPKATERLRRLARSILKRCSPEELVADDPSLRVVDSWPYGDLYVLEHLWRRVGLPELIGELLDNRKFSRPHPHRLNNMILVSTRHGRLRRHRARHDRGARGAMLDEEARRCTALHGDQGSLTLAAGWPMASPVFNHRRNNTANPGERCASAPGPSRPKSRSNHAGIPVKCSRNRRQVRRNPQMWCLTKACPPRWRPRWVRASLPPLSNAPTTRTSA